ncbi:hypothetical protein AGMMS50293_09000 [Spirochaetia bacterium]|nr:hypothetical protein AGMMS50293_09000 [Spirochaetia bacterium]
MKEWTKLPDAAWTSRFWAFYQGLPEPIKEGFTSLAQSLDRDVKQQEAQASIKEHGQVKKGCTK